MIQKVSSHESIGLGFFMKSRSRRFDEVSVLKFKSRF